MPAAALGAPRGDGHDSRRDERTANLHDQSAAADADERLAESRNPGDHGSRHLDGHELRRRRHEGGRERFRRDGQYRRRQQQHLADGQFHDPCKRANWCPHGDGRDGIGGTSGPQPFTINAAFAAFTFTGGSQTFTVPAGVATMAVTARGAQGGSGASSAGGLGGVRESDCFPSSRVRS